MLNLHVIYSACCLIVMMFFCHFVYFEYCLFCVMVNCVVFLGNTIILHVVFLHVVFSMPFICHAVFLACYLFGCLMYIRFSHRVVVGRLLQRSLTCVCGTLSIQ